MNMAKHWKSPSEKKWFSVIVDGRRIDTQEESSAFEKEVQRIKKLAGVNVVEALPEHLMKVRAHTKLPKRIYEKMEMLARLKK
jgi:hypothetical protein